ncbi:MAG: class I SAM-dependent methyltransferase [Thermoplasmata archaeon]
MDSRGMTEEEWRQLVESLEDVEPYYEKVNSLMTFGLVDRWRRRVASYAKPEDVVLEIGSGPGNFARLLPSAALYCLEPSEEFSRSSRRALGAERVTVLRGVGERIPLADASIDKVFCMFSFRDFFDRAAAAGEMHRVLREGGEVFIADVAKPASGPLSKLLDMHFRYLVPVLARVAVSPSAREVWNRDPYAKLIETYEAYGTPTVYEELLRRTGFSNVSTDYLEMKGATMTRGKKPWKSTS